MTLKPGVFLDRDGVINRVVVGADGIPHPPQRVADVVLLPGVEDACDMLRAMGHVLVVVTNQPDVARGTQSRAAVEAINALICNRLGIDHVRVCYHDDSDGCACRKPQPGLIVDAARDLGIDLTASFMVGDRSRDIEAGRRAGCLTILVGDGYGESVSSKPDASLPSLAKAAAWIAERARLQYGAEGEGRRHGS
jgi:D-glycero-D-manno-heptose 1,7-bisphosphate phosphatase